MAVAFTSLKVGDTIYDCHRHKLGNTTASELGVWLIKVLEINQPERKALVSWNGNTAQWKGERYFESTMIKRFPPEWSHHMGSGMICNMCGTKKINGHRDTCKHPKARNLGSAPLEFCVELPYDLGSPWQFYKDGVKATLNSAVGFALVQAGVPKGCVCGGEKKIEQFKTVDLDAIRHILNPDKGYVLSKKARIMISALLPKDKS